MNEKETGGIAFSALFCDANASDAPVADAAPRSAAACADAYAGDETARAVYERAVAGVRSWQRSPISAESFSAARALADEIAGFAERGTQVLFDVLFFDDAAIDSSLVRGVNVAVLASDVAHALSMDASTVRSIALAGLLRTEAAAVFSESVASDPAAVFVAEILALAKERSEGGYPRGSRDQRTVDAAQIVCLCDSFEAMTHRRWERSPLSSVGALKSIIEGQSSYATRIMRSFIGRVGIYPKGTYVELNTKEIARVERQNAGFPASPTVEVVINAKGEKAVERRIIDLSKGTRIYVVCAM